ncbi:MAG: SMI1/KNR4 family protein [Sporocytophaga sp.]|nr:SMI1/KNR4 family protein [Sporocytophaga sp.]
MKYLRFLKDNLDKVGSIIPCTENEIRELEFKLGVNLPKSYREYLLILGKDSGDLFAGSFVSSKDLLFFKNEAVKILIGNNFKKSLEPQDLVFLIHQGYQFMFFKCDKDEEDPKIYFYDECKGQTDFEVIAPSFSSFIEKVFNDRNSTLLR